MSTKSKGRKHEKEARELYEGWGYQTWNPANSSRCIGPGKWISQSQDIAQCFDFMAWNESEMHLVQVKTWNKGESHASEARKLIDEGKFPTGSVILIVMARLPRKPGQFIMWEFYPDLNKWGRFNSRDIVLDEDD